MNKLPIIALIVSIITLLLVLGWCVFGEEITIDQTKEMLEGDPTKIAQWMAINMKTANDSVGYAQPPKYTYKYKKGDCEDITLLAKYFIGDRYETYLVSWCGKFNKTSKYYKKYKGRKLYHAVLAVKEYENKWGIIDQERYITGGKSLGHIVKLNCEARKVDVIEAYIVDLYMFKKELVKKINLEE